MRRHASSRPFILFCFSHSYDVYAHPGIRVCTRPSAAAVEAPAALPPLEAEPDVEHEYEFEHNYAKVDGTFICRKCSRTREEVLSAAVRLQLCQFPDRVAAVAAVAAAAVVAADAADAAVVPVVPPPPPPPPPIPKIFFPAPLTVVMWCESAPFLFIAVHVQALSEPSPT